ncbi:unnamed protein product [Caretta caretta]
MWTPTEEEKYGVVICSFRGSIPQGLVLELGETVQILEKCEVAGTQLFLPGALASVVGSCHRSSLRPFYQTASSSYAYIPSSINI